jgi:AraC-like DNA-binding protein
VQEDKGAVQNFVVNNFPCGLNILSLPRKHLNVMLEAKEEKSRVSASGYERRLKGERADKMYLAIWEKLIVQKRYKEPGYTAKKMAEELDINIRYISAIIQMRTGGNFNSLVNKYRLRDACKMLRSPRYERFSAEEIGLMAGYASRQAFYLAFSRHMEMTPAEYRTAGEEVTF